MRVLFDTNVVLDVLLDRQPHADAAAILMSLVDTGKVEGLLCATTVTMVHFLTTRSVGTTRARRHMRTLLEIFDVAAVDREVIDRALALRFPDFEDAVLHEAAVRASAAAIVTRNGKDFAAASLPVFAPRELLATLGSAS